MGQLLKQGEVAGIINLVVLGGLHYVTKAPALTRHRLQKSKLWLGIRLADLGGWGLDKFDKASGASIWRPSLDLTANETTVVSEQVARAWNMQEGSAMETASFNC